MTSSPMATTTAMLSVAFAVKANAIGSAACSLSYNIGEMAGWRASKFNFEDGES